MSISVSNDELRGVKETAREFGAMVEAIATGEVEKWVITKHGKMVAVIVSVEEYSAMLARAPAPP